MVEFVQTRLRADRIYRIHRFWLFSFITFNNIVLHLFPYGYNIYRFTVVRNDCYGEGGSEEKLEFGSGVKI